MRDSVVSVMRVVVICREREEVHMDNRSVLVRSVLLVPMRVRWVQVKKRQEQQHRKKNGDAPSPTI